MLTSILVCLTTDGACFLTGISTVGSSCSGCLALWGGAASGLLMSGRALLISSCCMGESITAGVFLISSIVTSLSSRMGGRTVSSFSLASGVRETAGVFAIAESGTGLSICIGGRELSSSDIISGRLSKSLLTFAEKSTC